MKPIPPLRVAALSVVLCAVAGCASPSPTPTVTPANPERVCEQLNRPGALDCHQALAVAIAALPPGDRPIRASFAYGTYCAMISNCGMSPRVDFGLVYFVYAGTTHQEYVYVVADATGRPRLGGTLSSAPPPVMSVPTSIPQANAESLSQGGPAALSD